MENIWDIRKIQEILPQKYPFLFIDKVLEIDKRKNKAVCLKNITFNEYFFEGHFPDNPITPGVIIIEALAQASIILYANLKPHIAKSNPNYYLGKVEAKFKKPVRVGDQLILEIYGEKVLDKGGVVKAIAKVDNEVAVESKIVFGVELKNE
jgi:3-hydroxyacyl-[acyl-carrier-protein] dehydratase